MTQVTKFDGAQRIPMHTPKPRGQAGNVVQLPPPQFPNEATRLRQAASHRDECTDCIEMGFVSLLTLATLLSAAALLRCAGLDLEIAHYALASLGVLATAAGIATLLAFCLALVHFLQLRQL